jgi:hypothetical protein
MDFSIEHYTVRELIQILDIPETQSIYDKETFKEAIERTVVCIDDSDNENIIEDIIVFLVNVYQKLCNFYKLPLSKEEIQFFVRDITNLSIHTKKRKKEEKDTLIVPYDINEDYDIETEASRLIIPRKEAYIPKKDKKQIKPIEKIRPSSRQIFKKKLVKKMYVFNSKFRKTSKSNNLVEKRILLDTSTIETNEDGISYSIDDTRSRRHFLVSKTEITNSSTNFEIKLDSPLTNVIEIQFKSMELLNSYYTINNNNNIFFIQPQFNEDDLKTGDLSGWGLNSNDQIPYIKISIPSGNYFGDSTFDDSLKGKIDEDIQNIINYSKIDGDISDTSLNIIFNDLKEIKATANKDTDATVKSTNRMVISFDNSYPDIDMSMNIFFTSEETTQGSNIPNTDKFLPIYNNIGYIFGFRKVKYTGDKIYIAESLFESQGTRNIYFYLEDDANSTSQIDNFEVMMGNGTFLSENILAKIPNYASTYNIQYETDADNIYRIRKYTSPVKINNLKIKLLDDQGNIIDNNNTDFTFTLEITSDPNHSIGE